MQGLMCILKCFAELELKYKSYMAELTTFGLQAQFSPRGIGSGIQCHWIWPMQSGEALATEGFTCAIAG